MLTDRHGADLIVWNSSWLRIYHAPPICEQCWLRPSPQAIGMDKPDLDIRAVGSAHCPHGGES